MARRAGSGAAVLAAWLGSLAATGCAPDDPFDFGGPRSCEPADQNAWVYSLMQEVYLWSDELPAIDPADYDAPAAMVADLRVGPDRWSRVADKARSDALFQEGKAVGLGIRTRRDEQDRVIVAEVTLGSPAAASGLERGDVIAAVGGLTTTQLDDEDRWSEVYGDNDPGVAVDFRVLDARGQAREVTLVKDWVSIQTVPVRRIHRVQGRPVGYLQFATFVGPATEALDDAFAEWNEQGVREVVIDLRYNGGGLVSVARHFMNLLAGAVADGRPAYRVRYNHALADQDIERTLTRLPPSLPAVDHVVFITTRSSLSASELLINSVAAHVPVSIVGGTTGGKPVGSKHFDFCDRVAAPITFELVNADDRGGYFDGLEPTCAAPDDLSHPLGDPSEASVGAALHLLETGRCPAPPDPSEGARVFAQPGLTERAPDRSSPDRWPVLTALDPAD